MSERYRKPEPGKSILTGSSHGGHGSHGPGKRTLAEGLPHRAPARRGPDRDVDRSGETDDHEGD